MEANINDVIEDEKFPGENLLKNAVEFAETAYLDASSTGLDQIPDESDFEVIEWVAR